MDRGQRAGRQLTPPRWVVDGGASGRKHTPPEECGVDGGRWAMTNAPGSLEEPGEEVEGDQLAKMNAHALLKSEGVG